jgi:hypothetical protein
MKRSVSTELELEAGNYTVLLKITGKRYHEDPTVEEVIAKTCRFRREKLLSIGLSYDLAHAKGQFRELEAEKKDTTQEERRKKRKETAMKMHAARVKQHKKQKLRSLKMNIRKEEKAMRQMTIRAEEQAQEGNDSRKMDDFRFQEPEQMSGLGIVNGNGTDGPKEYVAKSVQRTDTIDNGPGSPPTRQSTGSSIRQRTRPVSQSISSRPGSPFISGRRDTLTIAPSGSSYSSIYGAPGIRVHKASLPPGKISLSDISDDDLSWDDELDAPSDSDGDDLPKHDHHNYSGSIRDGPSYKRDEEDEFGRDPWNAVCVVGLRVYSKDTDLKIEVVRETEDQREDDDERQDFQRGLDVDDANKDPSREPVSPITAREDIRGYAEMSLNSLLQRHAI